MTKITKEMVNKLNDELNNLGVGFIYELYDEDTIFPYIKITVKDKPKWINVCDVYCTDEYFKWLENWFTTNYNITLVYNNTGMIIWSNNYV